MCAWNLEKERIRLENTLNNSNSDFCTTFMTVSELNSFAQSHPDNVRLETVSTLEKILNDIKHLKQTQSIFLYRAAADALASIIVNNTDGCLSLPAISALKNILNTGMDATHRAAAEAMGSLPLCIKGPEIDEERTKVIPAIKWEELLIQNSFNLRHAPVMIGRSLVSAIDGNRKLLVLKLALSKNSIESLNREACWMKYLSSNGNPFSVEFRIPFPLKINGSYLFRLKNTHAIRQQNAAFNHENSYAICFIAHNDYFTYPNTHRKEKLLDKKKFKKIILNNAWLLGKLTSMGIVHSAPIPLFHNQVQRNRRQDQGFYEWPKGGRLDAWLYSCRYPNFGPTGIRDFEHLITLESKSQKLYEYIGSHILSILLVIGSYFRNHEAERLGLDEQGKPVDARQLFDKSLFKELIEGVFHKYFDGFVGSNFNGHAPCDFDELAQRMIEEMGVDRHMEEILRAADQTEMTDREFKGFLLDKGYSEKNIEKLKKGEKDISILTGPHLGEFNSRISLPELIKFLETASAYCIAGKYWEEKFSWKCN
ncbi:MAG: SidJ-related pseudokinase [Deltaproteobacteria bacterium]|nr:SidJ-related pseudokinase [Deltaproteobacteria bacterium]